MHFLEGDYHYTQIFWPTASFITLVIYKNIIYDIGTKILNLQIFHKTSYFVNPYFLGGSAVFFVLFPMAVSKHDLKPSATFFRIFACGLGFAGYVSVDFWPLEGDFAHGTLRRMLTNHISKSSPYHHQIITISSPNHHQIITISSPNHHQIITKSSPNHHEIITKSTT